MIKWILPLLFCCSVHAQIVIRGATLRGSRVGISDSIITPLQVDTILDFHSETPGTQYSYNVFLDAWGNTNSWSWANVDVGDDPQIFTNGIGPDITLPTPMQSSDGHIMTSTGTNWLIGNLGDASGGRRLIYGWAGVDDGVTRYQSGGYLYTTNINAVDSNSRDLYQEFVTLYGVAQFNYANDSTGGQVHSGYHTLTTGTPSLVGIIPTNTVISWELNTDLTNGVGFVTYRYASNNALIFSSVTYATNQYADLINVFHMQEGYIHAGTISGLNFRGPLWVNHSHVNTNRPPWVPNTPASLSTQQSGFGKGAVAWTDNNLMLNSNRVSFSNATSGESVVWIQPQRSGSGIVSDLIAGTYDVRVESYFVRGMKSSAANSTLTITNILGTLASDTFNRANSQLSGSTLDNGFGGSESDTWTAFDDNSPDPASLWNIVNNQVVATTSGDVSVAEVVRIGGVSDVTVSADIFTDSTGVIARASGGGAFEVGTFYVAVWDATTQHAQLYKRVGGTFTKLGSDGITFTTGNTLTLNCKGTAITVLVNGVQTISATDSDISSGSVGMYRFGDNRICDSFSFGTL